MQRIIVLGGGMVGGLMARDLSREADFEVVVADRDPKVLARLATGAPIEPVEADLADRERVKKIVSDCDMVIGAVPGFLGLQTLKAVLEAGKNICDISFMPEDPRCLDNLAKEKGSIAVVDCGVAPGMSNMICGRLCADMDAVEDVTIFVGGLPTIRSWPHEYKAPFSPIDVIEEYTRPARYKRDGKIVTMPALSEPEMVDLPGVGTLEAFNTDGLRSLLDTIDCPNVKEKTLRYPGHREKMLFLRDSGFFGLEPVATRRGPVTPMDLTTSILFPQWKLEEGEEEFTVMRVQVTGTKGGERARETYDLLDKTDQKTGQSSMSRTTGFPNVTMARLILRGVFKEHGVFPPEIIGRDKTIFEKVLMGLREKGVVFHHHSEKM